MLYKQILYIVFLCFNLSKKEKTVITGEDTREGLTAIVTIKIQDPKYSSQSKDKLVSSEIRHIVENIIGEKEKLFMRHHLCY